MMNNLDMLRHLIEQWAKDRKLNTAEPMAQIDKLSEEFGELMKGINKNDLDLIKDSIGDMYVVMVVMTTQINKEGTVVPMFEPKQEHQTIDYLINISDLGKTIYTDELSTVNIDLQYIVRDLESTCNAYGITLLECVDLAYEEIKDRKGEMRNGKFVKEDDLFQERKIENETHGL